MSLEQIVILAIVQGITEFLPISSSGHLILIHPLTGLPDQGLVTDIMVHVGSLFAILVYFWRDVINLVRGLLDLVLIRWTLNAKLAAFIIIATIPAVAFGLILKATGLLDQIRGIKIVAWNAIIFGVLLYISDVFGKKLKVMEDMTLSSAMIIGVAQALALIPGTSRSGITMTAARSLGFNRPEAARFSFLLGIPAIAGAGVLTLIELQGSDVVVPSGALLATVLTFFSALAAIAFLMAIVKRMSFLPFVIYRLMLGGFLLVLAYT